ncbi:MAG: T9SS type A sorting domain-containing protein, partial [Bacteroidetes bacterium]|nr:T9SS type A sorting domain-containing protein [Bacteroidota bacterium]
DGSASSDADGTISSYSWVKASGPSQGSIANTSSASTTATNLVQGTYVFRLTVKDNGNATGTDSVIITVNAAANQAPVANAGSNKTITLPVNTVTLDGSASSDADGTISSFSWAKIAGAAVTISNVSTATATISGLAAGQYTFELTVTDDKGASAKATVRVTVLNAAAQNPVADAGKSQVITLPLNSVILDGSGSLDPDGSISNYSWTKISGPSQGSITNASAATTTATNLVQGVYMFKLTVRDNSNLTGSDSITITVNAVPNQAPVANAGSNKTITLPINTITLDGSASSDTDGTISSYSWTKVAGGAASINNGTTATPTISGLTAGRYTFELTVTDDKGATSRAQVKVAVNAAPNQPPVASAGSNKTITLPVNTVILDGSGSTDADGTIISYSWTKIAGGSVSISNVSTSTATISGLTAGQYTFELTVTDDKGATSKAQVRVKVNPAPNQPAVANAGSNKTITLPTNTVTLDGSGSTDADGTITSYNWTKITGGTANISNGNKSLATVSGLAAGQYTFELTITDDKGAISRAQVKITVNPAPNQAPVADAGASQTLPFGTTSVTLDGSKSTDPDGTITTYDWQLVSGPDITITNGNSAKPVITGLQGAQYIFELTVTDNVGATSKAQVKIIVNLSTNLPPVANAGANQIVTLPVSSTKLDGVKSYDPDGTIESYVWTKMDGPSPVTITNVNTSTPIISGLTEGVYSFKLTVTDNRGASTTAQVKITVQKPSGDLAPVADAGTDQAITLPASNNKTASIRLDGTKSYDADGSIVYYTWKKITGTSAVTIDNVNTASSNVSGLQVGQYTFELTVTDNNGISASDQVTIVVKPANSQSPVADAGKDIAVSLPESTAVLDGSGSHDSQGGLTYKWEQVQGPSASALSSATAPKITVKSLEKGIYIFRLTVTSTRGEEASDEVKITVTNGPQTVQMELYPNPASDVINAKIISDSIGVVVVNIYDINGRAVKKVELNKQLVDNLRQQVQRVNANTTQTFFTLPVNITSLGKGVYIIETIIDTKTRVSSKFVKY